ncbi:EAL domain-containing protein [Qipengyuania aquimaris]|uniref:EAL domain-containing protein n=1 Tax=Qipengyuania aquimaris TaxID=255984 RepID=UPI001FD4184D|nr:EAL domain-containing protein [Qipengyuania aquimaris]UOR14671.1 EAL domain-containing protein [Qipengyuania aquimaris]
MGGFFSRKAKRGHGGDSAAPLVPIAATDFARRVELLDSFENAGLGWFWATDEQGRLIYLSENAMERFGLDADETIGKPLTDLFIPCSQNPDGQLAASERPLAFYLSARNSIAQIEVQLACAKKVAWWELAGKPQFDSKQRFIGYRGSAKDVTITRESQRDAERLAQYDSLTGLSNRHRMNKVLGAKLTAFRSSKRVCALMMLDLDRFKQVNDTLGHPAGDELLKQVAARLERIVGDRGEIGRLGGDEFQIILSDVDDRGELGDLAARVIQMVGQPYSINGSRAIIGVSLGIAIAPYDGLDTEELVKAADLALYAAKGGGRGQYRFYSSDLKEGAALRRMLEEDLRDALVNDELSMHYQPIVKSDSYKVAVFESLIRWEHPQRGFVSPEEFVAVAEDLGIINEIGEWALRKVCEHAVLWPVELRVAVNVSATQFVQDNFVEVVKSALQTSQLDPARLELEITESVFIGDAEQTQKTFLALKKLGVRLALDDFGTGYSSLSYLQHAPFDKIKIDQSFVRGATEPDNNNAAIMSAIVGLADALGMETVCEGVETKDELKLVTARGATHIQGYLFSRPISHEQTMEKLGTGDLVYEPRGPEHSRSERRSVFRRIGAIHDDHRYKVVLRNISKTGAKIEGLLDVPVGTDFVLDLGDGQLAVAKVRRSKGHVLGLEFETPLISDGADGFCTRHRVSPYAIEAAGRPLAALPTDAYGALKGPGAVATPSIPQFAEVEVSGG